jgi:hypothetical protein
MRQWTSYVYRLLWQSLAIFVVLSSVDCVPFFGLALTAPPGFLLDVLRDQIE